MNKLGVKIAASILGFSAVFGVWQASSYNQDKQDKYANKGQQVIEVVPQPQPAVESQTEIPIVPLSNPARVTQAVPIEQPSIPVVTQPISIQPANTNNISYGEVTTKKENEDTEDKKEQDKHEKEEERD